MSSIAMISDYSNVELEEQKFSIAAPSSPGEGGQMSTSEQDAQVSDTTAAQ